jgi:divalent metal cation (Fe/Co/Zn/Cd) transporter
MNNKSKKIMSTAIISMTALIFSSSPAYAYLDPGTGSAILQGIIGAIAAIAIVLKLYWHRFLRILGIRKGTQTIKQESSDKTNS